MTTENLGTSICCNAKTKLGYGMIWDKEYICTECGKLQPFGDSNEL